jgi:ATP-binding cassette subfamily F protein 3
VYELFNGKLRRYKGNYSAYERLRETEMESLMARYRAQQEEIQKLEDFIRRFGAKATKAAQAQERQKMLDKMERIEIPESLKKIHFSFPPAPHSGRIVLTLEGGAKTYDGARCVFRGIDLVVESGERLVVVGVNGAGKSTLLRILAGADGAFDGRLSYGAGVRAAYFSQDTESSLGGGKTLIDLFQDEAPTEVFSRVRDMLGAFLFRGDDVFKTTDVLSGGEKSRVALLRLLLRPCNLLILDEPTNHLDLYSKDVLLDALQGFAGAIIFVSHDRAFIEALATRVLELSPSPEGNEPSRVRTFPGGYTYYLERLAAESGGLLPNPASFTNRAGLTGPKKPFFAEKAAPPKGDVPTKRDALPEAALPPSKNEKRRLERREAQLLAQITEEEAKKSALEEDLSRIENYRDPTKSRALQAQIIACDEALAQLLAEWEQAAPIGAA